MYKKLLYFCILLFSSVALASGPRVVVDGNPQVSGDTTFFGQLYQWVHGVTSSVLDTTTESFTLYVSATGSDTNDGLSSGNALATIQEAVNRVPKYINHDVTISVGSGSFANFIVAGFIISSNNTSSTAELKIEGTLGAYSPATGTASGTATGGSTSQLVDAGQAWTVNDLRGTLLLVDGEYRIVKDNDATTINVIGVYSASTNGKAYSIVEQKTAIDSGSNLGRVMTQQNLFSHPEALQINDMHFDGGTVGFFANYGVNGIPQVARVKASGNYYGIVYQEPYGQHRFYDVYVENATAWGFAFLRGAGAISRSVSNSKNLYIYGGCSDYGVLMYYLPMAIFMDYIVVDVDGIGLWVSTTGYSSFPHVDITSANSYGILIETSTYTNFNSGTIDDCGDSGIKIINTLLVDMESFTIEDNAGYGVEIDDNSTGNRTAQSMFNLVGTTTIQNNSSGGIICRNHSILALTNVDGSNTGYGLELQTGSYATITSDTGITGTTSDATINGGTTDLTWASDFSANGDIVTNIDNNCRIERQD